MPTLTIEAIKENPLNILTHELPEYPTRLLLILAELAATLCRQMQDEIVNDADWLYGDVREGGPPEYNEAVKIWWAAYRKQGDVIALLEERFGIPMLEFTLRRVEKKRVSKFANYKCLRWW